MDIKKIEKHIEWEKYYDPKFNWQNQLIYISLDPKIITLDWLREFKNKIMFIDFFQTQRLTEDLLEEVANMNVLTNLEWKALWIYQKVSEGFIERHKDKVNWYYISRYQKLSKSFLKKYEKEILNDFQNVNLNYDNKVLNFL